MSANPTPNNPSPPPQEPVEMSMDDIRARHKDTWVAMLVTARDKNFQPTRGRVVASDVDRYRLRRGLLKYPEVCIFYAGEPPYPLFL